MVKKSLFFLLLIVASNISASDTYEDMRLCQQYRAPEELARLLDEAYEQDQDFRQCVGKYDRTCKCPKGLACYVKTGRVMNRIRNLDKARHIISDQKLDEILLPQKYLWREHLVAEELKPEAGDTLDGITKKQLEQIIQFTKNVEFCDFIGARKLNTNNIFFTKDRPGKQFWDRDESLVAQDHEKKIAVIDTKFFFSLNYLGDFWQLFSRARTSQCQHENMTQSGDIDEYLRPKNFESFWQKYEECFQEEDKEDTLWQWFRRNARRKIKKIHCDNGSDAK